MFGTYKIECTATGVCYIGSSLRVEQRLRNHLNTLRANTHENPKLQRAWNKYGEATFVFAPLACALDKSYVNALEQEALDALFAAGECFNINRDVYKARLGAVLSTETRAKISASRAGKPISAAGLASRRISMRGVPNPMQGRQHSAETLLLISTRLKEGFAAGRKPHIQPPSEEQRRAQSKRLRETPIRKDKGKPVVGHKDGAIRTWPTTIACAKDIGCDLSYPSQRVDTGKTVKGWVLTYA